MKVPSHLAGLYHRTVRRYRKLATRLQRETHPTTYRRNYLLQKLKKLRKKIEQLHIQLKLAMASGVLVLSLGITSAQGQATNNGPFVPQARHLNPLREPFKFDGTTFPSTIDLDKDGDYDLVVADEGNFYYSYNGYSTIEPMRYFVNIGTNTHPIYEEKRGNDNPFNELIIPHRERGPVFADIDKDGDEDLFVGVSSGQILYYRNTEGAFTEQVSTWDPVTKAGNPLADISLSGNLKLAFIDMDGDADLDAIIAGQSYDYSTGAVTYINYFENDGTGTFTRATDEVSFSPIPQEWNLNPTVADIDQDGDADLLLGGYYMGLRYYKQVSPGNFVEETGSFDPIAKTGNPFDGIYEPNTQPLLVDFDNDSDFDLLLGDGDGDHYYAYPNNIIHYYENTGNQVFEERPDLENPLAGVDVKQEASPVLLDLDNDGDLDALIGHKYEDYYIDYNIPVHYSFEGDKFVRQSLENSPFSTILVAGTITPAVADIDADGDLDFITGDFFGNILLFQNNEGEYTDQLTENPFADISVSGVAAPELADLDDDGDLDLAIGSRYGGEIFFYENTGTPEKAVFEARTGADNPFEPIASSSSFRGYLNLADVDHDGDLDLLTTQYSSFKYYEFNQIVYHENVGTAIAPSFELAADQPFFSEEDPQSLFGVRAQQPYLADQDGDGDLDLFVGDYFGHIRYTRNENPAVATSIASTALIYRVGVDDPVHLDPLLTLADEDDDLIVQASIAIKNYQAGDELHFAAQTGIAGSFDTATGILTFKGKATRNDYQSLLRTVNYHFHSETEGGRRKPVKRATVIKSFEVRVYDTDFTHPQVAARDIQVMFNNPPVLQDAALNTRVGNRITISLNELMSDADDNLDVSTLKILQQPSSGATASIDVSHNLVINYSGVSFTGIDNVIIEVCDEFGECAQNLITIQVDNDPPSVATPIIDITVGKSTTFDLKGIVSDPNGSADLDFSSLSVLAPLPSGAVTGVDANGILTIDYSGLPFIGTETLAVQICDLHGACAENIITIVVSNAPPVIEPQPISTPVGTAKTLNLIDITNDVDGNLDHEGFSIVSQPVSGAVASIEVVSPSIVNLLLNYEGITFSGTDQLTIRACDAAGACTESLIQMHVDVNDAGITVYNAIAPGSSGDNKFMRITGLPEVHKVSVFNRWGDKVFDSENYNESPFKGENNNGTALASGTYFYTIEVPGQELITGYLMLRQ